MADEIIVSKPNSSSMDIRSCRAYMKMVDYLQDTTGEAPPNGFEDSFLEDLRQEADYDSLYGIPFFTTFRSMSIIRELKPQNLFEFSKVLVLYDNPALWDANLKFFFRNGKGKSPFTLNDLIVYEEEMRQCLVGFEVSGKDIDTIINCIYYPNYLLYQDVSWRDIWDKYDIPFENKIVAGMIARSLKYRQTKNMLIKRAKDILTLAFYKAKYPEAYVLAYLKFYASDKAHNLKTKDDFDVYEAQVTGSGNVMMSDYFDYIFLKRNFQYISWEQGNLDIVYKESELWKEIVNL